MARKTKGELEQEIGLVSREIVERRYGIVEMGGQGYLIHLTRLGEGSVVTDALRILEDREGNFKVVEANAKEYSKLGKEYGGKTGIPDSSHDDPKFRDNNYIKEERIRIDGGWMHGTSIGSV